MKKPIPFTPPLPPPPPIPCDWTLLPSTFAQPHTHTPVHTTHRFRYRNSRDTPNTHTHTHTHTHTVPTTPVDVAGRTAHTPSFTMSVDAPRQRQPRLRHARRLRHPLHNTNTSSLPPPLLCLPPPPSSLPSGRLPQPRRQLHHHHRRRSRRLAAAVAPAAVAAAVQSLLFTVAAASLLPLARAQTTDAPETGAPDVNAPPSDTGAAKSALTLEHKVFIIVGIFMFMVCLGCVYCLVRYVRFVRDDRQTHEAFSHSLADKASERDEDYRIGIVVGEGGPTDAAKGGSGTSNDRVILEELRIKGTSGQSHKSMTTSTGRSGGRRGSAILINSGSTRGGTNYSRMGESGSSLLSREDTVGLAPAADGHVDTPLLRRTPQQLSLKKGVTFVDVRGAERKTSGTSDGAGAAGTAGVVGGAREGGSGAAGVPPLHPHPSPRLVDAGNKRSSLRLSKYALLFLFSLSFRLQINSNPQNSSPPPPTNSSSLCKDVWKEGEPSQMTPRGLSTPRDRGAENTPRGMVLTPRDGVPAVLTPISSVMSSPRSIIRGGIEL